jgi:hypothetical protein
MRLPHKILEKFVDVPLDLHFPIETLELILPPIVGVLRIMAKGDPKRSFNDCG